MTQARKEFCMDEETFKAMLTKPGPVMLIGGVDTRELTQMSANDKWRMLGKKMGFIWDTATPIRGKGPQYFSAIPIDEDQNEST